MRLSPRPVLLALLLALLCHAPLRAQLVPGGEPTDVRAKRELYLAEVLNTVEGVLHDWRRAWEADDLRQLMAFYVEDASLVAAGGQIVKGRAAVGEALGRLLPAATGLRTTYLDFSASGDLAYYVGHYRYWTEGSGGATLSHSGRFVMALYHAGSRGWKIRSYLEFPDAPSAMAEEEPQEAPPVGESTGS
jgi:ketosteroid isomerase-like protein